MCAPGLRASADVRRSRAAAFALGRGCQLLEPFRRQAGLSAAQLDALSPLPSSAGAIPIARDGDGGVVKSVEQAKTGQPLDVTVSDGVIECCVSGVRRAGVDDIA